VLILAFDTSGLAGSLALLEGERVLAEEMLDPKRRSAASLAPAIAELFALRGVKPGQIRLVATTIGPGSFTGLRVGVTTAKTLAYGVGAEVMGVSTLEAIAHSVPPDFLGDQPREIQAVIDAQRKEFFVGRFRREPRARGEILPRMTRMDADRIVPVAEWLARLKAGTIVSGGALARLENQLPAGVIAVPLKHRDVKAMVVGRLAWRDYQAGRRDDMWRLAPIYLRPSYAEEKARK
jgi:tRNA threonylcarbamoyladenosine biosynthesis protein TsaB